MNTDSRWRRAAGPRDGKGTIIQHGYKERGVCDDDDNDGPREKGQRRWERRVEERIVTLDEFLEHYRYGRWVPRKDFVETGDESRLKSKSTVE